MDNDFKRLEKAHAGRILIETNHHLLAKVFITIKIIIVLITLVILRETFSIAGKSHGGAKSPSLNRRGSADA
jgi:hypothetical protein